MDAPLTIVWHPNLTDLRHGVQKGWWGTPKRVVRSLLLFFVFPGVLFGITVGSNLRQGIMAGTLFGLGFGALFAFLLSWWLARYLLRLSLAKGDPQTIVLTDEGVERVLKDMHIKHAWSGISRVEEDERLFILYGTSGPVASVEKSGVGSSQDLNRIRDFLRNKKPGQYLADAST